MVDKNKKDVKRVEDKCQKEMEIFRIDLQEEYDIKFRQYRERLNEENE